MGEQPIFSCKAHVFHIDPRTKRSWIPASNMAVSVSFFYDSTRNLYRIISVDGSKAIINSTITPNMAFTKTSQKFGQWSDVRANTVYGLGFPSETELNKFIEKFQEVKEATKVETTGKPMTNGTAFATTPVTSANASPVTGRAGACVRNVVDANAAEENSIIDPPQAERVERVERAERAERVERVERAERLERIERVDRADRMPNPQPPKNEGHSEVDKTSHGRSQSLSGLQPVGSPKHQIKAEKLAGSSAISSGSVANAIPGGSGTSSGSSGGGSLTETQLKYENDRLKLALAQSSANAKKWEVELSTLKSNNARLTSALQESTANVEEWKRQLHSYKEDNTRLKLRNLELEAAKGNADAASELRKELNILRQKIEQLELELKAKDEEVKKLSGKAGNHDERCKSLAQENAELQASVSLAQAQLETALAAQESQRRVLDTLNAQLAARVAELAGIHREVATALQT